MDLFKQQARIVIYRGKHQDKPEACPKGLIFKRNFRKRTWKNPKFQ
jgi:hypothetical protein